MVIENIATCKVGLYMNNTDVDWMILNMSLKGGVSTWTCVDGYSSKTVKTETKDSSTESNCMITSEKSAFTLSEDKKKADIKFHFMRKFDSGVVANDLKLELGNIDSYI